MTTKDERIAVTTEKGVKKQLERIAREHETSVSKVAAEMISFALAIQEDTYLDTLAENRMKESVAFLESPEVWQ